MKGFIAIISLAIVPQLLLGQSKNDYRIVEQIINELIDQNNGRNSDDTMIVLGKPLHNISLTEHNFQRIKKKYKRFEKATFEDFTLKNGENWRFPKIKIPSHSILVVDIDKYDELRSIRGSYLSSLPILEFSNIGFNKTQTQAIIYYGYYDGPLAAGGVYIIFEKRKSKWKSKSVIGAWSS